MRRVRAAIFGMVATLSLLLCSCCTLLPLADGLSTCLGKADCKELSGPLDVRKLACEIDCLEKQVEMYGTVVPKHADVWGQARLMMHRQEFEREMRKDVTRFDELFGLQAAIATSDQAFLASAFALEAAAKGGTQLSGINNLVSGRNDVISNDLNQKPGRLGFGSGPLKIEPTLYEDQKKRFLDHLHELRRINEGDDNSDAPGYALNLVRIPVSIIPGDCTQTGFGAECTVTATPNLPDDLLPNTFRNLVVNDLVSLLTMPVTTIIEKDKSGNLESVKKFWQEYEELSKGEMPPQGVGAARTPRVLRVAHQVPSNVTLPAPTGRPVIPSQRPSSRTNPKPTAMVSAAAKRGAPIAGLVKQAEKVTDALNTASRSGSLRPGRQRGIAGSQLADVLLYKNLLEITIAIHEQISDHLACHDHPYHLDVQASLRDAIRAAFDLLASERAACLWDFCTPALVEAIHSRDTFALEEAATRFRTIVDAQTQPPPPPVPGEIEDKKAPESRAITRALAWAIVVESALLNARLLEDMKSTRNSKGCACAPESWVPFYLPHPPQEAAKLFNDYVRCRWPLHVFALDPATEDQNVADSYRLRRESQLALSLAFANGQVGTRTFMNYVRRFEQDIDTVALNRTMVGFSHGDSTFGWRFYPRVQTPPAAGNLQTFFRDLVVGGHGAGYHLRRRRLEPGIRECVALVIMPSFVPFVDLEITGNWFRLAHPKCKALDLKDAVHLSRKVQAIRNHSATVCDQDKYRPGDASLVLRRLEQLSERLPLQHQLVNVPFENTQGGFELLSSGVTNLAPELVGWYGAPGINPNGDTTLFLVGDNFSVHQTRLVAGGRFLDSNCPTECQKTTPGEPCSCKAETKADQEAAKGTAKAFSDDAELRLVQGDGRLPDDGLQQAIFRNKLARPIEGGKATNITTVAPAPPSTTTITTTASPTATASPTVSPSVTTTVTAGGAGGAAGGSGGNSGDTKSGGTYQVELLSRQVMRVIIPKGVYSKGDVVDVHVATPYGVSTRLAIPILCDKPAPTPAPTYGYDLPAENRKVKVPYSFILDEKGQYHVVSGGAPTGTLSFTWNEPIGAAVKAIDAVVKFKVGDPKVSEATFPVSMKLEGKGGTFEVVGNEVTGATGLALFGAALLAKLEGLRQFTPDKPLPATLESEQIVLTPTAPTGHVVKGVKVPAKITVEFERVPYSSGK